MSTHWATRYIGVPWQLGAKGPHSFDCWNFVRHVEKEHFGVDMPTIDEYLRSNLKDTLGLFQTHPERKLWHEVDRPKDGDVTLMCRVQIPVHIGIWLQVDNTAGVLHCLEQIGVVFQKRLSLMSTGWGKLAFYRRSV